MNVNKSLDILWFLYKTHKLQVTSHQINSSIDFHQHVCSSCTLSGCGWYVVFMQAVVSGSSVRVVAVWRWWRAARPGPLPRPVWSCSVCSVVRQARPSAEQHGDTMQWPKHRDQGTHRGLTWPVPGVETVVTWQQLLQQCGGVAQWWLVQACCCLAPAEFHSYTALQLTQAQRSLCLPASSSRAS